MPTANIFFDVENVEKKVNSILQLESYFTNQTESEHIYELPDILLLSGGTSIGVDAIREIAPKIAQAPNLLESKYIICKDCHLLTEAAQNALLKHLEQNYSYLNWLFFTYAKYEYKLLKTLRSRFVLRYDGYTDTITKNEIDHYVTKIRDNDFGFDNLNLDILLMSLFHLYQKETHKKTHWLKRIDRVIKIKSFEQSHLKWSKNTTLALIFTD
ncbi:MAG: hypothetical protein VX835_00785 [Pseudomonadota bacterium]|nr:hypothetical protein [Pseudomonadota bacterium]